MGQNSNFKVPNDVDGYENDPVNHPSHYTFNESGIEVIEITRHIGFGLGNAFKYVARAEHKDNMKQDLEKALWYLEDVWENMSSTTIPRLDNDLIDELREKTYNFASASGSLEILLVMIVEVVMTIDVGILSFAISFLEGHIDSLTNTSTVT